MVFIMYIMLMIQQMEERASAFCTGCQDCLSRKMRIRENFELLRFDHVRKHDGLR